MCARVLLASKKPLPLVAWDQEQPAFNVTPVKEGDPVPERFSGSYVYNLGSHTMCGCGFTYWPDEGPDPEARESSRSDLAALHSYLSSALMESHLEIFTCWDGDEIEGPVPELVVPPEEIDGRTLGVLFSPYFIRLRPS